MPRIGFFTGVLTAGGALVVLVFAGLFILMLFAIYAWIAAVIALLPVIYVEAKRYWVVTHEDPAFIATLQLAFLISGAAAFALDLIFKTYVSMPAMIDALDLTHNVPHGLSRSSRACSTTTPSRSGRRRGPGCAMLGFTSRSCSSSPGCCAG